jgi:hypothetical protein
MSFTSKLKKSALTLNICEMCYGLPDQAHECPEGMWMCCLGIDNTKRLARTELSKALKAADNPQSR